MKTKEHKILKAMFYSGGELYMPWVYAFVFLFIIALYLIVRLISPLGVTDKVHLSDDLIIKLFYGVVGLIGVATAGRALKNNKNNSNDINKAFDKVRGLEEQVKNVIGPDTDLHM
jgi:hypothetical protein